MGCKGTRSHVCCLTVPPRAHPSTDSKGSEQPLQHYMYYNTEPIDSYGLPNAALCMPGCPPRHACVAERRSLLTYLLTTRTACYSVRERCLPWRDFTSSYHLPSSGLSPASGRSASVLAEHGLADRAREHHSERHS